MEFVNIINSIGNADFSGFVIFLKILSAVISISLVIGIIYSWIGIQNVQLTNKQSRIEHFSLGNTAASSQIQPHMERWKSIVAMFQSSDPIAWRMAIIDADSVLEEAITSLGFTGQNFGEKLKSMQQSGVPWVQSVWDVHILRNKLAHEGSNYPLNNREAYQAFKTYESILYQIGYLA